MINIEKFKIKVRREAELLIERLKNEILKEQEVEKRIPLQRVQIGQYSEL